MKTGHVEKTNDRDYEVEERRFRTMEAASLRLQKEAKGYLDSLRGSLALSIHTHSPRRELSPNNNMFVQP